MSASEESLALLRSMAASLHSLDGTMKELLALSRRRTAAPAAGGPVVASDSDLDSRYGDEKVRFKPRDWSGENYTGRKMSECQPAFLDLLADAYAYFAKRNDDNGEKTDKGEPKSKFDRRSESRARGWAARIRAGKVAPKIEPQAGNGNGNDEAWANDDTAW